MKNTTDNAERFAATDGSVIRRLCAGLHIKIVIRYDSGSDIGADFYSDWGGSECQLNESTLKAKTMTALVRKLITATRMQVKNEWDRGEDRRWVLKNFSRIVKGQATIDD